MSQEVDDLLGAAHDHRRAGEHEQVLETCRKLFELLPSTYDRGLDPELVPFLMEAHKLWIRSCVATGDFLGATDGARDWVHLDPGSAEALAARAESFLELGFYDRALADATKLTEALPNHTGYWALLLDIYRRAGRIQDAQSTERKMESALARQNERFPEISRFFEEKRRPPEQRLRLWPYSL
jgi:tetratricopeptide (TPR) repeat protein